MAKFGSISVWSWAVPESVCCGIQCWLLVYAAYLFVFGCSGSSWLCAGFFWLQRAGLLCGSVKPPCRAPLVWRAGLRCMGFSSCDALWCVESSQTRDQTPDLCVGRWILIYRPTWEALTLAFFALCPRKQKGNCWDMHSLEPLSP